VDEFQRLWRKDSKWLLEMKSLNGVSVEVGRRELVDRKVFLKGKNRFLVQR
jgi:hypothetical protein